jgi:multidrug resistance efflux pump
MITYCSLKLNNPISGELPMINAKQNRLLILLLLSVSSILLVACSSVASTATENAASVTTIPSTSSTQGIIVEGRLVPRETVDLAFTTNGKVIEVLVQEGDQVKAGDVLARLGDKEAIESAIAGAKVELFNAQQSMDRLYEDLELARAEQLRAIAAANRAVRDAQYQLDNFTIPSNQSDLTALEAVDLMKENLDQARQSFEPYKNKSSNDSTRKDLKDSLDNAQSDYNAAVRRLEYEVELADAQAALNKAMQDYLELEDSPNPDDIAAAGVRLTAAEAALDAAEAVLTNLDLKATINGTVVTLDLINGQQTIANTPVISIADFSQWYVETEDLTEIEVVNIDLGQKLTITADALPEVDMTGTITNISEVYQENRGDITYTVKIHLDQTDPHIRWGMTVAVETSK